MEVWVPWIKIVGWAVVPFVFLWLAFRLKPTQHLRPVRAARIVSLLAALPIRSVSLFLLSAQSCEQDRPLIGSPDGKHVARMMMGKCSGWHVVERHRAKKLESELAGCELCRKCRHSS
jgi:hypothetical protein